MSGRISRQTLLQINEALAEQMGLQFPESRLGDLEQGLQVACRELQIDGADACLEALRRSRLSREQIEKLAANLTVGETYFFREQKSFEALERNVLPELIERRRDTTRILRFWSAGCSSGEEPYSLAILLQRLIPDWQEWNITILATDINPAALRKAETGVYRNWSFRGLDDAFKRQHFVPSKGNLLQISDSIRRMVQFAYLNLAEATAYPAIATNTVAMDLIFCRNVLMYFSGETIRRVTRHFFEALTVGGWVVTSPSEASRQHFPEFEPVNFPGAIFFRRPAGMAEAAVAEERSAPIRPPEDYRLDALEVRPARHEENPGPARSAPAPHALGRPPGTESTQALRGLLNEGRYEEVIERLRGREAGLVELDLLARAWANNGDLPEALGCCEQALAQDRLAVRFHYLKAGILQEMGESERAADVLRKALFLDRNFIMGHFTLGNIYRQQGRREEARRHFRRAKELLAKAEPDSSPPEGEGINARRLLRIAAANLHTLR